MKNQTPVLWGRPVTTPIKLGDHQFSPAQKEKGDGGKILEKQKNSCSIKWISAEDEFRARWIIDAETIEKDSFKFHIQKLFGDCWK